MGDPHVTMSFNAKVKMVVHDLDELRGTPMTWETSIY